MLTDIQIRIVELPEPNFSDFCEAFTDLNLHLAEQLRATGQNELAKERLFKCNQSIELYRLLRSSNYH